MALAGCELYYYILLLLQCLMVQGRINALCSTYRVGFSLDVACKNSAFAFFLCMCILEAYGLHLLNISYFDCSICFYKCT